MKRRKNNIYKLTIKKKNLNFIKKKLTIGNFFFSLKINKSLFSTYNFFSSKKGNHRKQSKAQKFIQILIFIHYP